MSEYEQVIDEIVKHGVIINVNKIVDDNYINGERKYVGCVVELDFSEHDKVFEDKIELLNRNLNLQKDKRCEAEIERNYLAERINQLEGEIASLKSHMLRIRERCTDGARRHFENGTYRCLTIVNRNGDLEAENEKLKQRIAELESKEVEKQKKRTGVIVAKEIDGQIYVTFDDFMSVVNDLQAELGT